MFKIIPQPTSIKPQSNKKGFSLCDATISDMPGAFELISFAKTALNKNISIFRQFRPVTFRGNVLLSFLCLKGMLLNLKAFSRN